MKKSSTLTARMFAALALLALATLTATAANLWWDPVPGTPGPGDGNGGWDTSTTNWWDGAQNAPWNNANNDIAVLGFNTTAATTVTLSNSVTVGGIIYSNAGAGVYTLGGANGSVLTLSGTPTILLSGPSNGVHVLSAPVVVANPANTLTVRSTLTNANSINFRLTAATNNIGSLVIGMQGNTSYTANGIWLDFNAASAAALNAMVANLTNVTVCSNASFRISGANSGYTLSPFPQQITISGDGSSGGQNTNNAGAWVVTGNLGGSIAANVVLAGDSSIDFNVGASAQTFTLGGTISGTGRLLLVSGNRPDRRHTCVLTNSSTYVGETIVAGGTTLQLTTGNDRLPTGTILTLGANSFGNFIWNSNGVLTLGNTSLAINQTVAGLKTGGFPATCLVSGGHSTTNSFLTVNNSADCVYAGNLGGAAAPASMLGLIKSNSGKLSLQGTNRCSGGYTVNSGTLEIGDGTTDRPLTGNITNNAVVTLKVASSLSYAGLITGAGALAKDNNGTLTLSALCSYTGATEIKAGTLALLATNALTGAITNRDGATLVVTDTGSSMHPATLTLGDSAANTLNFSNINSTATAPIIAGSLKLNGVTTINIRSGTFAASTTYPLVSYTTPPLSGTVTTGTYPTLPVGSTGYVTNNTSASRIEFVVQSASTTPPHLTNSVSGGNLVLSWPADHLGWRLEVQTNVLSIGLSNNWFTVAGSTTITAVTNTVSPVTPTVFYRLVYP